MRRHTTGPWLVALLVVLTAACSSEADTTTTTSSTTTTTRSTTTTTTAAPTTTTEPPPTTVTLRGDFPPRLRRAVEAVYNHAVDPANPAPPGTPKRLLRQVEKLEIEPGPVKASSAVELLENGDRVAVAQVAKDVLILVRPDGEEWLPVAAMFDGLKPWLGPKRTRSVLVLGSDARVGEDQRHLRADSIHILSMVSATGKGTFLGFPRDSWIGGRKLTDHMPQVGPGGMVELIEDISSLDLEGYLLVGFEGFLGLMEELGSLKIDLPRPMRSGNTWDNYPEGPQKLSPKLALRLARIRKGLPAGDFDRSFNQGLIVQAAMAMVQNRGIEKLPRWVAAFDRHGFTNLGTIGLVRLAAAAYVAPPDAITNLVVPARVGRVGAASVVFINDSAQQVFRDLDDAVIDED